MRNRRSESAEAPRRAKARARIRHLRRRFRHDGGNVAVEFALIAPMLLTLLFGTIEASRAIFMQSALIYSVDQAARCAGIDATTCGTPTQVRSYAAAESGAALDSTVFTATTAACGNLVTATYPMRLGVPFMNLSVTLSARSCYPT
jgi:Flp pilus assembly protein TadG